MSEKNAVPIRVDIPIHLNNILDELCRDRWGEKSRIIRRGIKLAIKEAQEERQAIKNLHEKKVL